MQELTEKLENATAAIETGYFWFGVAGEAEPIYRERVYCYELYHQLRSIWPDPCDFVLNGEVDKAGHPILKRLGVRAIPDLLVHTPGNMAGNYAIIEVKPGDVPEEDITKDQEKLTRFARMVGYRRAIFLVYGGSAEDVLRKFQAAALTVRDIAPIELWHHSAPGLAARKIFPPQ